MIARSIFLSAALCALALGACTQSPVPNATGQNAVPKNAAAFDDIKKWPDFYTGFWEANWRAALVGGAGYSRKLPFTEKGQKFQDDLRKIAAAGGDVPGRHRSCIPSGYPGDMAGPETILAMSYSPGRVTMTKSDATSRQIYVDGRPIPKDGPLSFQGFSIGHWEGNALVVETGNLDPTNEMMYAMPGGKDMHAVERIFLKDPNTLEIDTALEAPEMLKEAWKYSYTYFRYADWAMIPFDCAQNNRDVDAQGNQQFSFTPPN